MTTLTWLHLSDLHFRLKDPQDRKDPTDLIDPEDREGFESLLSDIKKIRKEGKLDPDAVFFTGDVVFSGQKEQYDLVGKWFDEILEACDLSGQRDRLFIVPGNHDVNRNEITKVPQECKAHEDWVKDLAYSDDYDGIEKFLKTEAEREWAFPKFKNFAHFIDEFFHNGSIKFDHNRYYSVRPIKKDEHTVVVIGLNSA